jgi:hypothetical protein
MSLPLVRLFVGGVALGVSEAELAARFARFGDVAAVERVSRKLPGGVEDSTACNFFLDLAPNSQKELQQCIGTVRVLLWAADLRSNLAVAARSTTAVFGAARVCT